MNRSDTRRQVTPGFAGMRKDDDGDYDETDSGGFGKVDMPKQARSAMGMQDDEEASEMRQKGGMMGGAGMKAGREPPIKGQDISDSEEEGNPARKVVKGREEPKGHEPEIDGSHQGSGDGGEPRYWSNLGHGEREATIGGSHMGKGASGGMAGEGFEAGGSLSKERAKGPTGTKR
jgi:hypothetical protein